MSEVWRLCFSFLSMSTCCFTGLVSKEYASLDFHSIAVSEDLIHTAFQQQSTKEHPEHPDFAEEKTNHQHAQILRIPSTSERCLKELMEKGGIDLLRRNASHLDFYVANHTLPNVKEVLLGNGVQFNIIINNVQEAINSENRRAPRDIGTWNIGSGHPLTFNSYHRYNEIINYFDHLARTHSNLVTVGILGTSAMGRPLKYLKISSGHVNPKAFWIDGGTHAREWISVAVATYIIHQFVEHYDAHVSDIRGIDFYILPVLNPDGYEYTHVYDRFWRKNRRRLSRFCIGADLNRNWGYKWKRSEESTDQFCPDTYSGPDPFSEPETSAVANFILRSVPRLYGFVSIHSFGQRLVYPFAYERSVLAQNNDELQRVGMRAARAILTATGSQYSVGTASSILYPASGGAQDWAKAVANIKFTYTLELRDQGHYGFLLPTDYIVPTALEALAVVKTISAEIRNLY